MSFFGDFSAFFEARYCPWKREITVDKWTQKKIEFSFPSNKSSCGNKIITAWVTYIIPPPYNEPFFVVVIFFVDFLPSFFFCYIKIVIKMRSFRIMLFCVQKTLKPPYNLHFLCHFLVIFWGQISPVKTRIHEAVTHSKNRKFHHCWRKWSKLLRYLSSSSNVVLDLRQFLYLRQQHINFFRKHLLHTLPTDCTTASNSPKNDSKKADSRGVCGFWIDLKSHKWHAPPLILLWTSNITKKRITTKKMADSRGVYGFFLGFF